MLSKWSERRYILVLFVVLAVVRLPTFIYPILDEDEAIHAAIAATMAVGGKPYLNGVDSKPPLLLYQYTLLFKLFGLYNMFAVHVLTALVVLATCWLLSRAGDVLFERGSGKIAGLAYALFSTASFYKILASNFELHLLIFECLAVWLVLRGQARAQEGRHGLVAGLAIGLSLITKQQGGMLLLSLPVAYGFAFLPGWNRLARCALGLVIGAALTGAMLLIFAYVQGYAEEMLSWIVTFPRVYIGDGAQYITSWRRSAVRICFWLVSSLPLWWVACRAVRCHFSAAGVRFALTLLLFSFVPVSLGGRYYAHYFLLTLPGLCLLAARGSQEVFSAAMTVRRRALVCAFTILPIMVFWLFSLAMPVVKRLTGVVAPDYKKIGGIIRDMTVPDDRIFVWGWAPEFYVFSGRLPASRFVFCDYLSGRISASTDEPEIIATYARRIVPGAWERLREDFDRHPPKLIIDTAPPNIHNYRAYPVAQYEYLSRYLATSYDLTMVEGIPLYVRRHIPSRRTTRRLPQHE